MDIFKVVWDVQFMDNDMGFSFDQLVDSLVKDAQAEPKGDKAAGEVNSYVTHQEGTFEEMLVPKEGV